MRSKYPLVYNSNRFRWYWSLPFSILYVLYTKIFFFWKESRSILCEWLDFQIKISVRKKIISYRWSPVSASNTMYTYTIQLKLQYLIYQQVSIVQRIIWDILFVGTTFYIIKLYKCYFSSAKISFINLFLQK